MFKVGEPALLRGTRNQPIYNTAEYPLERWVWIVLEVDEVEVRVFPTGQKMNFAQARVLPALDTVEGPPEPRTFYVKDLAPLNAFEIARLRKGGYV